MDINTKLLGANLSEGGRRRSQRSQRSQPPLAQAAVAQQRLAPGPWFFHGAGICLPTKPGDVEDVWIFFGYGKHNDNYSSTMERMGW